MFKPFEAWTRCSSWQCRWSGALSPFLQWQESLSVARRRRDGDGCRNRLKASFHSKIIRDWCGGSENCSSPHARAALRHNQAVSPRLLTAEFLTLAGPLLIVAVYAPTDQSSLEMKEHFYSDMDHMMANGGGGLQCNPWWEHARCSGFSRTWTTNITNTIFSS